MPFEVVTPFVMDMNAARIFAPWTAGAVLAEVNHKSIGAAAATGFSRPNQ
jgi:hypothetical protein